MSTSTLLLVNRPVHARLHFAAFVQEYPESGCDRLAIETHALSIHGLTKPPGAEMIEYPEMPGLLMKAPEHPLQYLWCVSYSVCFPYQTKPF